MKQTNRLAKWVSIALACISICVFSDNASAQRSSRGGSASKPSASKPSSPSKSPSRSPSVSKPSAPKPKAAPAPSKPTVSKPTASKPSNSTVSKPTTKAPEQKASIPPAKNNAVSSGRNSSITKSKDIPKPNATALSGETRPRPPPSANAKSSGRNASLSKPATSAPALSAADKALYERAKQSGKVFTSREQATNDFKTKYAKEFTTKFPEEPKARPAYVPPTYAPSSKESPYTVVYNQRYGGYGYWNGGGPNLGTFILYDALTDSTVSNNLMTQKGYYYGPQPSAGNVLLVIGIIFGLIVIGGIVTMAIARK